ncbi:DNA (cytosine-5-)-methyltransferase, partial [Klebsiella pneumoniae]
MIGKAVTDDDRSTEPHETEFSFYEFFAGGGMARAGLGKQWRCLFANDMDPIKASTYIDNWGDEHFDIRDVRGIPSNDLPRHADLTWASFPCQDLSLAGNGLGIGDRDSSADEITRSGAVWPFLDLISKLSEENRKPPLLVLENVLGLLTLDQGRH